MRSLPVFVLAAVLCSAPAFAQAESQGQPTAEQAPKNEKVKCKRLDDDNTGSNMKRWKKVCKTEAQWKADALELEQRLNAEKN